MIDNLTLDREQPWKTEPDEGFWTDPATGLKCAMLRTPMTGNLCGYVKLPRSLALACRRKTLRASLKHPGRVRRGVIYDHRRLRDLDVHGGVTYCGRGWHYRMRRGVWIGFDTSHAWDFSPGLFKTLAALPGSNPMALFADTVYRDWAFVREQCTQLARQIKATAGDGEAAAR